MPLYLFKHPHEEFFAEVFFHMEDVKEYIDSDGNQWIRQYTSPELKTEASIDPWNNADFVNKTNNKGTLGDLMDRSAELSAKRADQNGGVDPVKEKYYSDYAKKRKGQQHPDKMPKSFEDKNIKIDL